MWRFLMLAVGLFSLSGFSPAQPAPDSLWTRCHGGPGDETALRIRACRDHGFIIAGSQVNANWDAWLVRTGPGGDTLWTRNHGEPAVWDQIYDVIETADSGFAFVRFSSAPHLLKTDVNGELVWTSYLGYQGSYGTGGVVQCPDGGYGVVCGRYVNGFSITLNKVSAMGEIEWQEQYVLGGSFAYSLCAMPDGGFAIAGWALGPNGEGRHALLVRTDSVGALEWSQQFGSTSRDEALDLMLTPAGNILLAGWSSPTAPVRRAQVWEVSAAGELQWSWQSATTWATQAVCVTRVEDQWILGGSATPGTTGEDVWIGALSDQGELQWEWYAPLAGTDRIHGIAPSRYGAVWVGMQSPGGPWDIWMGEVGWPPQAWIGHLTIRSVDNDLVLRWQRNPDYPYYHVYSVHPVYGTWNWLGMTTQTRFTIQQPSLDTFHYVVTGSTDTVSTKARP